MRTASRSARAKRAGRDTASHAAAAAIRDRAGPDEVGGRVSLAANGLALDRFAADGRHGPRTCER